MKIIPTLETGRNVITYMVGRRQHRPKMGFRVGWSDFQLDKLYHLCYVSFYEFSCMVTPYSILSTLETVRPGCPLSLGRCVGRIMMILVVDSFYSMFLRNTGSLNMSQKRRLSQASGSIH